LQQCHQTQHFKIRELGTEVPKSEKFVDAIQKKVSQSPSVIASNSSLATLSSGDVLDPGESHYVNLPFFR
jgi:hypothetical protein